MRIICDDWAASITDRVKCESKSFWVGITPTLHITNCVSNIYEHTFFIFDCVLYSDNFKKWWLPNCPLRRLSQTHLRMFYMYFFDTFSHTTFKCFVQFFSHPTSVTYICLGVDNWAVYKANSTPSCDTLW